MNMELKRDLVDRLEATAPEYGLLELSYPSFFRCYGYRLHPLSAADAVEEAIYNALCMAETMVGNQGHTIEALPLDRVKEIMSKYM